MVLPSEEMLFTLLCQPSLLPKDKLKEKIFGMNLSMSNIVLLWDGISVNVLWMLHNKLTNYCVIIKVLNSVFFRECTFFVRVVNYVRL